MKENKPTGPNPREGDDHVFVTFEFPGTGYWKKDAKGKPVIENNAWVVDNADDVVVVTYSSISTNGFEKRKTTTSSAPRYATAAPGEAACSGRFLGV